MKLHEFKHENISADVCVVGGGMAGLCAAIAAARNGANTVLVQDRSVLGGNASSEIRMWICGARCNFDDKKIPNTEAGILEEIRLSNYYHNPELNYSQWDHVLYGMAKTQKNLTLILNCSVNQVQMDGDRIQSVTGWQLSSQKWITIEARFFADCSGDSVLRISGAEFCWGREGTKEFGEGHAPDQPDKKTMGNSILVQCREVDEHHPFALPAWAHNYNADTVPHRDMQVEGNNFWWLEVGGTSDTIADSEELRHELLRIAYGIWGYIKNHPDGRGHNWELEWIGSVPGKRENVRYVGDHVLTQQDVEQEGKFDDRVAYGGWPMDDHHPDGLNYPGAPTIFYGAPSPYGIPYRCLYSKNIENLFFAGRNISATHMALSSTRVMGTCSILGQAVGTAAALAIELDETPRGILQKHIGRLQQQLMDQDMFIPWMPRETSQICRDATLAFDGENGADVLDGVDRELADGRHAWVASPGDCLSFTFKQEQKLSRCRIVFDSNFSDHKRMPCSFPRQGNRVTMPTSLVRDAAVEVLDKHGEWVTALELKDQFQRAVTVDLPVQTTGVRLRVIKTWGNDKVNVFAFEVS